MSVQRLKDEQGNFERKIQELEQQNLMIAKERESILSSPLAEKNCKKLEYSIYIMQWGNYCVINVS